MTKGHLNNNGLLLVYFLSVMVSAGPTWAAQPLKLMTNSLPDGTLNGAYSAPLSAQGGAPPYAWSVTVGALPTGLVLNPTTGSPINVEGIPSAANVFNFTVTVTDSVFATDSKNYTVTISAGACAFVGSNQGTVNFGDIDPSSTGALYGDTGVTQVQFTCAAGKTFNVTPNPAGPTWTLSGPGALNYSLGLQYNGTGYTGTGAAMNLLTTAMGSSIQQADYQNAEGGLYTSSPAVSVTIDWPNPGGGSIVALIDVSANILKICTVTQSAGNLVFAIDPSLPLSTAALAPAGQDLKIKCTFNAPISMFATSTCGGLAQYGVGNCNGGYKIPYTFNYATSTTGAGFGLGLDFSLGIGGSAAQAGYADAPGGSGYGDTQTVTISY